MTVYATKGRFRADQCERPELVTLYEATPSLDPGNHQVDPPAVHSIPAMAAIGATLLFPRAPAKVP